MFHYYFNFFFLLKLNNDENATQRERMMQIKKEDVQWTINRNETFNAFFFYCRQIVNKVIEMIQRLLHN